MKKSNLSVAVVFAKENNEEFNRCSFPIMGRPVFSYPLLAALNSKNLDFTYISTGSERIINELKSFENVRLIKRNVESPTIMEEFYRTAQKIISDLNAIPATFVILLGNSPCILSKTIDNALEIMANRPDLDSVVTAEKRHFHNPGSSFRMTENGLLENSLLQDYSNYQYFIDARLAAIHTEFILNSEKTFANETEIYGKNIFPILQEEGVSDIDYTWQVPLVERWLKKNGFSSSETPYGKKQKTAAFLNEDKSARNATNKYKVFISTIPFGEIDQYPLDILKNQKNCVFLVNPMGRKLKEAELAEIIKDYDVLIAGTEPVTAKVMDNAPSLKLISRVGIGLDNVDLNYARKKGIAVSYTPDAPSPAVAELTIGHILNLCRSISLADRNLRDGVWSRIMGSRLANKTIGIIGTGRVGSRVLKHLQGFMPKNILVNDIKPDKAMYDLFQAELVSKETIYKEADIITLHIPLTAKTRPLISRRELEQMKPGVFLVNTSRGGIINERDLIEALKSKRIAGAAIDVYMNEPYGGELITLNNCSLTCHMGSCSTDCRFAMEKLATEEVVRFLKKEALEFSVPDYEYEIQRI